MDERREQRNTGHRHGIDRLVAREMAYARAAYGDAYHSAHEGYAVIREEVLEAETEIDNVRCYLEVLDHSVRRKMGYDSICRDIEQIRDSAENLAIEAIHIAAAAEKYVRSFADTNAPQA